MPNHVTQLHRSPDAPQAAQGGLTATVAAGQNASGAPAPAYQSAEAVCAASAEIPPARTAPLGKETDAMGLTNAQAAQLTARGQSNRMPAASGNGAWPIVRRNLFTLFNLLNCALAALLIAVGSYRNLLFMGVVVSNALIGLTQELRAKRTHDRLLLLSEARVRTLRDGVETRLPSAELVLGDVIRIRRGDQVPADATVLAGVAEVNEALLTGESEPLPKATGDALLSGSFLTEGELTVRLTAVGTQSFAGQLQQSARKVRRPESELMASLRRVIRVVSILLLPVGGTLYLRQTLGLGLAIPAAVTKTVAAALGMIPEGLILLTSVALAVGVVRLGRRNALVNELYGIENLARVDVLCLDKTGTLTSGNMRVADVRCLCETPRQQVDAALRALSVAFAGEDSPTVHALAEAFPPMSSGAQTAPGVPQTAVTAAAQAVPGVAQNSESAAAQTVPGVTQTTVTAAAKGVPGGTQTSEITAEQTVPGVTQASVVAAEQATPGATQTSVTAAAPTVPGATQTNAAAQTTPGATQASVTAAAQAVPIATRTIPFSSDRKWSAATFPSLGTFVLGAPEKLLTGHAEAFAQARRHAAEGLRVLALLHAEQPPEGKTLPLGLTPMALVLLGDTLRPDAAATLRYFEEQGVAVKVISGDSPLTVARIAAEAGLNGADRAVDCSALANPVDYDALAKAYTVFGRVSPEDKRQLVGAFKRQGHAVGMIGDGVNDVPALKAADCSIAMAGGSDAAARVAQITLLGADFSVMPGIVLEGRRVINNITRASALFLVKNLFSFLLAVLLLVLPFAYPFAPIQLTLVSTLTIGFPSFVLALQPNRERVRGRFLRNVLLRALPGGFTVTAVCLGVMVAGRRLGLTEATVSTVCTLVAGLNGLCVLAIACHPMDAIRLALTLLMAVALTVAVLLFPGVFYLTPLAGNALWLLVAALASTVALLGGFALAVARRANKAEA